MLKKILIILVYLSIILNSSISPAAGADDLFRLFVQHIDEVYLPGLIEGMSQEQMTKWKTDPSLNARIFGYVLSNQLRFFRRGSEEDRIWHVLERECHKAIMDEVGDVAHENGWSNETYQAKKQEALRMFESASAGWLDRDMTRRTKISPEDAPNFFATLGPGEDQEQNQTDTNDTEVIETESEEENIELISDAILGKWSIKHTGRYDIPENKMVVEVQRVPGEDKTKYVARYIELGEYLLRGGYRTGQKAWELTYKGQSGTNVLNFDCRVHARHQTGPEDKRDYFRGSRPMSIKLQEQIIIYNHNTNSIWIR